LTKKQLKKILMKESFIIENLKWLKITSQYKFSDRYFI
jgi:hypothetical protein